MARLSNIGTGSPGITFLKHSDPHGCHPLGCGSVVPLAMLEERLDSKILEVFSNTNDSVISRYTYFFKDER